MATKKKTATATRTKRTTKTAKKGKAKVTTVTTVTTTTTTEAPVQTKVGLVIDSSGSMRGLEQDVIRTFNGLLNDIRTNDPTAEVTVTYFGAEAAPVKTILANAGISQIHDLNLNTYRPYGNTPLFDGVAQAVQDMGESDDAAYILYILTDGHENASRMSLAQFQKLIREKQSTDRFTFGFLVPPGSKDWFVQMSGAFPGNVKEWEASSRGLQVLQVANTASVGGYYATRSTGQRATRGLFDVDLSSVSTRDFNSLPDVTGQFKIWNVDKESDIKSFVESHGQPFKIGHGFYNLVKKETVQDHKQMMVMKKGEKTLKSDARDLLGLPSTGDVRVNPHNLMDYVLFIQSTSNNRKLPTGSKLAYRIN